MRKGMPVWSILSGLSNGTLSGTVPGPTYTRNPDFNGSDSFTLKMNGGKTDSGPATVFVTVAAVPASELPSGLTATGGGEEQGPIALERQPE